MTTSVAHVEANSVAEELLDRAWRFYTTGAVISAGDALSQFEAVCQVQKNCSKKKISSANELKQIICITHPGIVISGRHCN